MKRRIPIKYQGITENGAVCTGDLSYKRNGEPCIRFWTENGYAFRRIAPDSLEMVAVKIKPIINFEGVASCGECPSCGAMVETDFEINCCFNCGQRLDWSDFKEETDERI